MPIISEKLREELRPHMIAGAFWYGMGFVTLGGIHSYYGCLAGFVGSASAVLIDLALILIIFSILMGIQSIIFVPKAPRELRVIQVSPENVADSAGISYKSKVRIVVRNDTKRDIDISNPVWLANGEVSLELPPRLKLQLEREKGGVTKQNWTSDESPEIHLKAGWAFRTWIGLHDKLEESKFAQIREAKKFGTLILTVKKNRLELPI